MNNKEDDSAYIAFSDATRKAFGGRIIMLREEKGLTQKALAKKSGISQSILKIMEDGSGDYDFINIYNVVINGLDSDFNLFADHPTLDIKYTDFTDEDSSKA